MTGTSSSSGRSFLDNDGHRNQEWLRRRKLRLEQVRKQSNEIAKMLREKVINSEKTRLDEYDRISEAKFNKWKAERLDELEKKLFYALDEFGNSYRVAEEEPDAEEVLKEKYQENFEKAQMRGALAVQEEIKKRKIAEDNRMAAIMRKKLIRKKEDLRSALVLSVPVNAQLHKTQEEIGEKIVANMTGVTSVKQKTDSSTQNLKKKVGHNKARRKKPSPQKSCKCKQGKTSDKGPNKKDNTIWINLNEVQRSACDSELRSSKSSGRSEKYPKEKLGKGAVEFYDFSSRYYCKSFKEFPHSVERIGSEPKEPNAKDLAKIEGEKEESEMSKKVKADVVSQERGLEALRREKIRQDFNNLLIKLEELNKKEKLLKAQQRNLPSFLHMSDERLHEKLKSKQRMMDWKFESIYYTAASQALPKYQPEPKLSNRKGQGDCEIDNMTSTRLNFSPATSEGGTSVETFPQEMFPESKKDFRKRKLLEDIDSALREGRELRRAAYESRKSTSADEVEEKETSEGERLESSRHYSEKEEEKAKCQDSEAEYIKSSKEAVKNVEDLKVAEKVEEDSLPVSSSTSYKSPPSVIRSFCLRQFLEYLGVNEAEGTGPLQENSKSSVKVDEICHDLLQSSNSNAKSREINGKSYLSPSLEYYIEKLLDMTRESVAELSVSSENVSTPNITDFEFRDPRPLVSEYCTSVSSKGEELILKSRMERADQLEKNIRNWKRILENDSEEQSEEEDVPDCPQPLTPIKVVENGEDDKESKDQSSPVISPKITERYEEITKKCSERISELSHMLDKVRKDKEKLLTSTSGGSSVSLNKEERNSEKRVNFDENLELPRRESDSLENMKTSVVEEYLSRYNPQAPRRETVSTTPPANSHTLQDIEESLESWPDVMDELLKRRILTSPFKWSDGDYSSELTTVSGNQTKPSSIETVIGNFRREINKIKPFTLCDSVPFEPNFSPKGTFEEKYQSPLSSPKSGASSGWQFENEKPFQEESSVESINHALTTLGLNWAKSFLRKNEESKAMSSTSNSEGESSSSEADSCH